MVICNDLSHDNKIDTNYTTNFRIQREQRVCKLLYTVSAHIQKISFQDSLYYAMGGALEANNFTVVSYHLNKLQASPSSIPVQCLYILTQVVDLFHYRFPIY